MKTKPKKLPNPVNDELYREVAENMDLPVKVVKDIIVNGQSKFTASIMSSGTFGSVRWPYLGVFKAKVKVANILNYMKGLTKEQKIFFQDQYKLKKEARNKKLRAEKYKNATKQ